MSHKINFKKISTRLEAFIADIDMSYFIDQVETFMKKNLNENMTEDEAIDFLEVQYLFNDKKNKPEILLAADILRALRMIIYEREHQAKVQVRQ